MALPDTLRIVVTEENSRVNFKSRFRYHGLPPRNHSE
jgi:hypothetical protein